MKMKGIIELHITDVGGISNWLILCSVRLAGKEKTVRLFLLHTKKTYRKRGGTSLLNVNLSNREGEWSTSVYLLL